MQELYQKYMSLVMLTGFIVFNAKRTPISVVSYRHEDKSSDDDV